MIFIAKKRVTGYSFLSFFTSNLKEKMLHLKINISPWFSFGTHFIYFKKEITNQKRFNLSS